MKTTFEDYKKAILNKYEVAKNKKNSHYLFDPTPANLKKLASEMCGELSFQDELIFTSFFNFKSDVDNRSKAILNFDTDKFRPLSKFLNKKTSLQEINNANLLAVLIELENRPFLKFKETTQPVDCIIKDDEQCENGFMEKEKVTKFLLNTQFSGPVLLTCLVLFVAISAFAITKVLDENCMVWKEDHYERIDCEKISDYSMIVPLDTKILDNFKKIKVSDSTKFFKNGRPAVWYLKQDNICEFFTSPGLHPVTKKTLKQITPYIIGKYAAAK